MKQCFWLCLIVILVVMGCSKDATSTGRLDAPTDLTVEEYGTYHLRLDWQDNSKGEESFRIDRRKGEGEWIVNVDEVDENQPYCNNNVGEQTSSNTLFAYRVRAYDAGDYSPYSNTAAWFAPQACPDSLQFIQLGQDSVRVTWADHSVGEDGFELRRRSANSDWQVVATTQPNSEACVDVIPALYDTLFYTLAAVVGSSRSEYIQSTYKPILPIPGELTIETVSITSAHLAWQDTSTEEDGYYVYRSTDLQNWDIETLPADSEEWVDTSIQAGVTTYYQVMSYLGENLSPAVEGSINTVPAPVNLFAEASADEVAIELTWQDISLYEDSFELQRRTLQGGFEHLADLPANSVHYVDTQIQNLQTYFYRIITHAQNITSQPSEEVSATCTIGHEDALLVPSQYASIQAAINAAEDGSRIIVFPGLYHERINFNGKSIALVSMYSLTHDPSVIENTIIDGSSQNSVIRITAQEDSLTLLQGFTVQHGINTGGIYCSNSRPTIKNMIIKNNHSTDNGGGLRIKNMCNMVVDSVHFEGNYAIVGGGGMTIEGESVVTLTNSHFEDNTAFQGGGLEIIKSFVAMENNDFIANNAEHGGGLHTKTETEATILHCRFLENVNEGYDIRGGALYSSGSTIAIENSIFAKNAAIGPNAYGGAIYMVSNTNIDLLNVVLTDNEATLGGAVYLTELSDIVVRNCIAWENLPYDFDINGRVIFMYYTDVTEDFPGNNNINKDPIFMDPDNYDYHLHSASPCIDAGDPDDIYLDVDGSINDMGAYGGPNGNW